MRRLLVERAAVACALTLLLTGCSSSNEAAPPVTGGGTCDPQAASDALDELAANKSCILSCSPSCTEATDPWVCPMLDDWSKLPHDCGESACGAWDGTYPTPQNGQCSASEPTGDAVAKTSVDGSPAVLPDGRRIVAAGKESVLDDPATHGTFPYSAIRVPGTRFVVVSDDGYDDAVLRVLDTTKIGTGESPIASQIVFAQPQSLDYGLAFGPDGTLYAASGAPDSVVRAFSVDAQTGALTAQPTKDIPIQNAAPGDAFPSGIDVSPDGTKLVVAQVKEGELLVYGLDAATYGQKLDAIDVGAKDQVAAVFDPASSDVAYVSAFSGSSIYEVNLATRAVRAIDTGKQPEEIVFFDANYLGVADSLEDDIAIVDRAAAKVVTHVPADETTTLHGTGPSALAYDAATKRLYATLSSRNAVAVFDVTPSPGAGTPPSLSPAGLLPTGWWPTDVVVAAPGDPDPGSLVVLSGKGHGIGPMLEPWAFDGHAANSMRGSVQAIDFPDATTLSAETDAWKKGNELTSLSGVPQVVCPEGAGYDFPIPKTNTEGPSKAIDHIVFIVRENKSFDGVFGDMPGVDGDASLVMAPGQMDAIWGNARAIARTFAHADNFYEDAEQSIQGHFWTAYGRTSDYTERTWLTTWGRGTRSAGGLPLQGVSPESQPVEGGIFDWLLANHVSFDDMGELLDNPGAENGGSGRFDSRYGVVSTSNTTPDTQSACYIAARARVLCDLKTFSYVWLVNDHAFGAQPGKPNPGIMVSVNDEATGMIVDALSHGPLWKSSLVVVIEDDPSNGGDHVDAHRSIALFASPWVKRGYVSRTHFDVASIHKLFAHVLGLPYNNRAIADAVLPFDLFTSTPDYTPFDYVKRGYADASCNPSGTKIANEAVSHGWDFTDPDDQPGLDAQNWRMLHGER